MRKRYQFTLVLLVFASIETACAQTELDPVTVTASMQATNVSNTGRNIIVVKGSQFSRLPVNSIDELLRYLPGIEVQMRGPMGAQSDLVLRGGTFQQVLVILDGIRINDPNTGHFNSYIPIAPAEIERIEILKGAASAIYGSEAVGGVIQIITKTFDAKREQESKQLSAQVTAGAYGLLNTQFGGFYQKGKNAISGGVLSNNASGQQQRGIKGFVHNTTASISATHFIDSHWSLALRSVLDKRRFAAQNFYTVFASDTATESVSSMWNQLRLAFSNDEHQFTVHAGYKAVTDDYRFNPSAIGNLNRSYLMQGLATYQYQANVNTGFTGGLQWINKKIRSNDRGNHTLNQAGGFVIVNQRFGNFYLNPALRTDWKEGNGWEIIPQMNMSFKVSKWQFRAVAGKTTRDADFTERFNNYNKTFVASGSIGNPDLEAERSFSYEAGVDFYGIKHLRIASTLFRQQFSNLIDYVPTPYSQMPRKENLSPTGIYALANNIVRLNATGLETDLVYTRTFTSGEQVTGSLGLTWINTEGDLAVPSFYVSSHAKLITNFSVLYAHQRYSIAINGLYKQREPRLANPIMAKTSKEYFVLNVKLQAFVYRQLLSIFVQADNAFNETYSDLLGARMPGRWLMAGGRFSL